MGWRWEGLGLLLGGCGWRGGFLDFTTDDDGGEEALPARVRADCPRPALR